MSFINEPTYQKAIEDCKVTINLGAQRKAQVNFLANRNVSAFFSTPLRYLHPRSDPLELDTHFWELRDSVVQCELLMLRVLCFRVSFQHPHKV